MYNDVTASANLWELLPGFLLDFILQKTTQQLSFEPGVIALSTGNSGSSLTRKTTASVTRIEYTLTKHTHTQHYRKHKQLAAQRMLLR